MTTSPTSICHEDNAEQSHAGENEQAAQEIVTIICPKHGEHEHAILSNIEGHEGAWCQLCWLESLGPSLPYKTKYR